MKVSILVCSYGEKSWETSGRRALDSTGGQGAHEAFSMHLPFGTLAQARNEAALAATGDWLCFLDADDRLAPGYLDAMRLALHSYLQGVIRLAPLLVPSLNFRGIGAPVIPAWEASLIDMNCACIGTLVPRSLFLTVGGFKEWPIYEDWDLWLRCVKSDACMVAVRDAVYEAHGSGRNTQPSSHVTYAAIRADHEADFPWHNVNDYKKEI